MTMMATKVKLTVGQPPLVLLVSEAAEVPGNYGPQVRITGVVEADGTTATLYEKVDAVTRQLQRCGLTVQGAVGTRLAFWKEQAQNGAGQTFPALRIEPPNGAVPQAQAPVRAAPAPATPNRVAVSLGNAPLPWEQQETGAPPVAAPQAQTGNALPAIALEYMECLTQAQKIALGARLDTMGGDTAGAVCAIAATLFIEKNKRTR